MDVDVVIIWHLETASGCSNLYLINYVPVN